MFNPLARLFSSAIKREKLMPKITADPNKVGFQHSFKTLALNYDLKMWLLQNHPDRTRARDICIQTEKLHAEINQWYVR
jgi:hypothetical protein